MVLFRRVHAQPSWVLCRRRRQSCCGCGFHGGAKGFRRSTLRPEPRSRELRRQSGPVPLYGGAEAMDWRKRYAVFGLSALGHL